MTDSAYLLPLYRLGRVRAFATVSLEDGPRLAQYTWSITREGYAYRSKDGRFHAMRRDVLGLVPGDGKHSHHVNEDKLDNRRENLQAFDSAHEHLMADHPKSREAMRRGCSEAAQRNLRERRSAA